MKIALFRSPNLAPSLVGAGAEPVELAVTAVQVLVVFAILFVLGRWLYRDARSRGSEWAWQWATGIPLLLLAGVVFGASGIVPGLLAIVIYLQLHPRTPSER